MIFNVPMKCCIFFAFVLFAFAVDAQEEQSDGVPVEGYKDFSYNINISYGTITLLNDYSPDSIVRWEQGLFYQSLGFGLGLVFDRWDLELSFRLLYNYGQFKGLFKDARLTSFYISGGYNLLPQAGNIRWDARFGIGINPGQLIYNGKAAAGTEPQNLFFANRLETQLAWRVLKNNPQIHLNPAIRLGVMWSYVKKKPSPFHDITFYPSLPLHIYSSLVLNFGFKERVPLSPGIDKIMKEF